MNKKTVFFIVSTSLVLAAGYAFFKRYRLQQPDQLLPEIRKKFIGVETSYISYTPERYKKFGVETKIFRGGLSTNIDGFIEDYEFIVDAYTGELIDCVEVVI